MSLLLSTGVWLLWLSAADPTAAPVPLPEPAAGIPAVPAGALTALDGSGPASTSTSPSPPELVPLGSATAVTTARSSGYSTTASAGAELGLVDAASRTIVAIDGFDVTVGNEPASGAFAVGATEPVQVSSSGIEATAALPSVRIDLREQRGTNEWRAAAGGAWTGGSLASQRSGAAQVSPAQAASGQSLEANALDDSRDGHLVGGGPLLTQRLWFWGTLGGESERWTAFGGDRTTTSLVREAGKLNAQLSDANSLATSWNRGHQDDHGLGAGPDRAPQTTLGRTAQASVWTLDDTQVESASAYWGVRLGAADSRLDDRPAGFAPAIAVDAAGISTGSWFSDADRRRLASASAETALLLDGHHDLKIGGEVRQERETSDLTPPGLGLVLTAGQLYELPTSATAVQAWRAGQVASRLDRFALWTQDEWAGKSATVTAALRFDRQTLSPEASAVAASPFTPILPGIAFSGSGDGSSRIRWNSISPRVGSSWSLDPKRRVLFRVSLARYGDQLDPALAARLTPTAPASAYTTWYGSGPILATDPSRFEWVPFGFDPLRPGIDPNVVDPRLHPEWTDEATASCQLAPSSGPVWTLTGTVRRLTGVFEDRLLVRDAAGTVRTATTADWIQVGNFGGFAPYYDLRAGLTPTGGSLLLNGDREQRFAAVTLASRRPLRSGWALQGHVTLQDWTWRTGPSFLANMDPTPVLGGGQRDGELVAQSGSGVGGLPAYPLARWSGELSGLIELPWQSTLALAVEAREGFPVPYFAEVTRNTAGPIAVLANEDLNTFRYDRLVVVNAHLERETTLATDLRMVVFAEAFNLLNSATVLRREGNLDTTRAGFVDELLAPRVFRLGVRFAFR